MDIVLALGGGGAKGNSHIGVLRRLEKEGYKIRAVAGTSFGGMVAIFYASGFSPDEIEKIFSNFDQTHMYDRGAHEGPALLGLSRIHSWLDEHFGEKTFADLRIPCAVTAVDILSGGEVILSKGNLVDAILSTIALPGIFPAHHMNGWQLVDGGVLDPVPVSVARMLTPGLPVVAVVLNEPLNQPIPTYTIPIPAIVPRVIADRITRMNLAQAYDIFMRSVDAGGRAVAQYRLAVDAPEVIVRPNVHAIEILDRVDVHEVVDLGEAALVSVLPELKRQVSWPNVLKRKLFGGKT